jgi:ferredoxin-like protein FixX
MTHTPVARFQLHGNHTIILRSDNTVTCDTCSLSATMAKAVVFAYENGVINMTIDGAPLKRI